MAGINSPLFEVVNAEELVLQRIQLGKHSMGGMLRSQDSTAVDQPGEASATPARRPSLSARLPIQPMIQQETGALLTNSGLLTSTSLQHPRAVHKSYQE